MRFQMCSQLFNPAATGDGNAKGSLLNPKYVKSVFLPLSFMKTTPVCYGPYARHCVPNPFAQRCCSSQFFV